MAKLICETACYIGDQLYRPGDETSGIEKKYLKYFKAFGVEEVVEELSDQEQEAKTLKELQDRRLADEKMLRGVRPGPADEDFDAKVPPVEDAGETVVVSPVEKPVDLPTEVEGLRTLMG